MNAYGMGYVVSDIVAKRYADGTYINRPIIHWALWIAT